MPAYGLIDQAIAGLQLGQHPRVDSALAGENILFGAPVFGYLGDDGRVWGAHQDTVNGLFSAVLVTANSISGSITIKPNGAAAGTVVNFGPVVFATDSPTTMTAIIAAINAAITSASIAGVTASLGATALTINVTGKGVDITAFSAVVTLGASQATFSSTFTTAAKFKGVALFIQTGGRDFGALANPSSATAQYLAGMAVNVLNLGYLWVVTSVAVLDLQPVYVIIAPGATQGQFTNVAGTNNYSISANFRASQNSQGLAVVEVKSVA